MTSYNAILTLNRKHSGAALADEIHDSDLDAYHVITSADDRGRAQIIITISAENLPQAITTARAILVRFTDQVRMEVMSTAEYDRADVPIPALISVTEAAKMLGISRQAVLSRINNGTLVHTTVGQGYAIPAAAIRK